MELSQLTQRAVQIRKMFAEFEKKNVGKEWGREQIMEGLVTDVGDLARVVMAKEGYRKMENVDYVLSAHISDCLWSILILADKYGLDLEKTFLIAMDEIEERLKNKLT